MGLAGLNNEQRRAVEYFDGPLLIVAGAGTGKTTVITEKIEYLITKKNVSPESILALTFTEKATQEMQERVDSIINIGYVDLRISTFHAFGQDLLERYGLDIGLSNRFRVLTETDAWLLIQEHFDEFALDYYRPLGSPYRFIHELLKHFSKCKDECITHEAYLEYAEGIQQDADAIQTQERSRLYELAGAYHAYNQLLLDNQSLDFADLIFYSNKLLRERPHIREEVARRFKYILVDEFQDVNFAQYQLVQLLASQAQLTVVGDDDQSIYAFRGASVSNILHFKRDFPNATEIVLTQNYRSGQNILDHAYTLIQNNNPDRLEVQLGVEKKLIAASTKQSQVTHIHTQTGEEEVRRVVQEIASLKEKVKGISWDDIAILVRANTHAEPFLQALEQAGIPCEFLSASGLYRQSVVVDCFHFLKVVEHIYDNLSIYRLLRLPMLQLSENDIQKFTHMAKKKSISYYETLKRGQEFQLSSAGIIACQTVLTLIHAGIKRARTEQPAVVLLRFLEESGYIRFLTDGIDVQKADALRAAHHLKQFFECLDRYQQGTPGAHVAGFVEHYTRILDSGDDGAFYQPSDTPDSVNIMTVHGAKGLEFRYVFIVNCVEQRFPTRSRGDGIELPRELIQEELPQGDYHYQEERRLFYVALTRAKEHAYVTSASHYGGVQKKKLSRFLIELGYETTDKNKDVEKQTETSAGIKISAVKSPNPKVGDDSTVYKLPKSFSFSQLRAFQVCPYQYKMTYLLKIPLAGTPYFSFGTSIHATLQRFYQRVQELNQAKQGSLFATAPVVEKRDTPHVPSLEELLTLYEKAWIDDWYQNKRQREAYFKKGKEMLKNFYAREQSQWTVPIALESGFTIRVGEYTITGKIDRIDQTPQGGLHIIDYKTGEPKEKIVGSDKDQLVLYQLATSQLPEYRAYGLPEKLTYLYLSTTTEQTFLGDEKELDHLQQKIVETINAIRETDFSAITKKDACGRCDFCAMCEFRI